MNFDNYINVGTVYTRSPTGKPTQFRVYQDRHGVWWQEHPTDPARQEIKFKFPKEIQDVRPLEP